MSLGQAQLVKWSLPALALILGLFWYKRRRVDRVDPGGASKQLRADDVGADEQLTTARKTPGPICSPGSGSGGRKQCDSGINSDESLNVSTGSPAQESVSPRKVSENLDIPGRSSLQSLAAFSSNTPWYDDVDEDTPAEIQKIIELGSQPAKIGCDLLSKSKSSAELIANGNAMKKKKSGRQQPAKIVVANSVPQVVQEFQNKEAEEKPGATTPPSPPSENHQLVNDSEKKQTQVFSERDSANHSPVSGVLDGSVTDEARSEGSTDSGKGSVSGGSIKGGHPKGSNSRTFYDFAVPSRLVGKLIGRGGKFLQQVRSTAHVGAVVKEHPTDTETMICSIEGTPDNISAALEIIRQHFPEKTYPNLSLEQIVYDELLVSDEVAWVTEQLIQLSLVEGVNNDVIVSHIIKPDHFFIQLPTHPTYPSLRLLDERMTEEYDTVESPPAPDNLSKGMILVAKWYNKWVRVYVEDPLPEGEQTLVRLVDHGGYWTFNNSDMRKIRTDYLTFPFQAIEVFLANIKPKDGEWTQEAYNIVAQLSNNSVGQAQIVGYVDYSTFINLYFNVNKHGFISIAEELIARGLAEPMPLEEVVFQGTLPVV